VRRCCRSEESATSSSQDYRVVAFVSVGTSQER
jgi:hypothetical protein